MLQRLKMQSLGIKPPKLGSIQDRVIRTGMTFRDKLEIEKTKFQFMIALSNLSTSDASKSRGWTEMLNKGWENYVSMQFNLEVETERPEEVNLREYYEKRVKHLRPKLRQGENGYVIEGIDSLFK